MRKLLSTLLVAAFAAPAFGADIAKKDDGTHLNYIPYGNLSGASKGDVDKAAQTGADIARQMLETFEKNQTPETKRTAQAVKRRADDIADASISADRDKILQFLGINNESSTALYYFLTWEMPIEMMRSYAIDAMWSGGTLVFKGVPPGKKLGDFILKDLRELVYGKGASANISMDPRLFDAYQVTMAPTIVVTNVRANFSCQGVSPKYFEFEDKQLSYDSCPPIDPSLYHKMAGGVTTQYALQTFLDNGATEVKPFLAALAKGFREGDAPGKEQAPFKGKWDTVLTPADVLQLEGKNKPK